MKGCKLISVILLLILSIIGCDLANKSDTNEISSYNAHNEQFTSSDSNIQVTSPKKAISSVDEFEISVDDVFETQYTYFTCAETAFYRFERFGELTNPIDKESEINWKVYILDDLPNEIPRYISPQDDSPTVINEGGTFIKKGQYILVYCSYNAHTYDSPIHTKIDNKPGYKCYKDKNNANTLSDEDVLSRMLIFIENTNVDTVDNVKVDKIFADYDAKYHILSDKTIFGYIYNNKVIKVDFEKITPDDTTIKADQNTLDFLNDSADMLNLDIFTISLGNKTFFILSKDVELYSRFYYYAIDEYAEY